MKWRNKKRAAPGRSCGRHLLSRHRPRFELLEQRQLLTASTATPAASDPVTATVQPSDMQSGALAAPTISLPTQIGPILQPYATQIDGVWVSDPGASEITFMLSVQHGTLSLNQYEGIVYDLQTTDLTISGDGTSTITLTGTAAEIYDVLDVPPGPTFADGASNATASSAASTSVVPQPGQLVPYSSSTGSVLNYTPASGYFGNDALTVSAFGTSGSTTSPPATAKLLLDDLPPDSGPWVGGFGATLMPTGSGSTATVAFNNDFLPIEDQQAGVNPIVVTVSASYGPLTLNGTTGLTVTGDGTDSLSITGSVSDIDNALNGMTYTPGAGFTGSDTLEFTANDQGYNALHQVQTATNSVALQTQWISAPVSRNIGTASSLAFNAANGTAISVSDFDLAGGDLQLEISAGYGALKFGETTGLTFVNTTNGQNVMVVEGTAAALNSALATLVYTPPSPPPYSGGLTYDTAALALSDPSGGLSPNSTLVQNTQISIVSGPNDTPLTAPGQATFTQPPVQAVGLGTPVTFSNANGNAIVISDPGMGNTIETLLLTVTEGTLKLAEDNGITFKYGANGSSTITIQGTLAALNAAIDGLVYTPNSGFAGIDTLSLGFSYPNNNYGYGSANFTIDEGANNQGVPISTPVPVQKATPAAPIIFSSTGGNGITLGNPGISATTPVQLVLSVGDGSLSLAGTSGITIVSGANGGSAMTIQGTLSAINAALDGMTYTPAAGDVGWTELDLKASVPGNSSIGTTVNSVLIQDSLVFYPAVISVPPTQTPSPTTPFVFSSAGGNGISINDPAATGTVQVALAVSSGSLTLGNTAGVTITAGANGTSSLTLSGIQAAINAALDGLTYTITYGTTNYDTLTIDLTDPGNSTFGTVLGSVAIDPTFPFGEIPFSEFNASQTNALPAPVVTLPAGPFAVNGTPVPVAGVSVAGAALVELTLSVQNGTLNVSKTAGVEVDNGGTSSIELSGTVANVNAALATLVYTGNAGFVGTDSLSVSATAVAELAPPADVLNGPAPTGTGGPGNPINYPIIGGPIISNPIGTFNTGITNTGVTTPVYNMPPANQGTTNTINVSINPPVTTSNIDDSYPYSSVLNQWTTDTSSTTTATLLLSVEPPTINVPPPQRITGLLPLVFSTADGNAISVSDSAVGNSPIQVTLSVANGTLTLASTTGLTFSTGTGTGNTTMTFTGDTSDIDAALDGLSYSADAGFTGTDTLNISVNDLGNGGGSPITVSDSLAIHVGQIVPPTITISLPTSAYSVTLAGGPIPGVSVSENGSDILQVTLSVQEGVLSVQNTGFSTSVNGTSVETMTSATTGQSVTITGVGTSTMVMTGTAAAIDALLRPENPPPPSEFTGPLRAVFFLTPSATPGLVYTPTSGFTGTDTLTVSAKDAGLANAPTTSSSLSLNVQPPTINAPSAQTMTATAPLVFSTALGNAISITQGNVGAGPIQVTLSVDDGTLSLASTAGLTFSTGTGTDDAAMMFSGDTTDVNAALAGLSYSANSGFAGNDKLIISVGTPGGGSSATVSDSVAICVQQGPVTTVPISLPTAPVTIQPVGGQIPIVALGDLGTGLSPSLGNAQITFSVQDGTLTLPLGDGLTITGNGTSSITVTGQAGWLDTDLITENLSTVLSGSSPGQLIGYRVTSDGLFYTPYSGYSGPDTLTVTSRSLLVNNAPTTTATLALNDVAAVAPVVTPSGDQATFTPGGSPVAVDSGIQITSTNTLLSGATVTISPSTFQATDTLRFSAADGIYGIYAHGVLTLAGDATPAQYQTALQSVTFGTGSTSTTARSISIVVFDASLASNTASEQVLIAGGSAAPTLKQSPETSLNRSGSSTGSPAVAHGHHSIGSLGMLSGSNGGHNTISLDSTPTGPTSGGFNYYVPPSLTPPVAVTTSRSGGSSTAGTANQTSGKKSFGPLDHVFEGLGPDDLLF